MSNRRERSYLPTSPSSLPPSALNPSPTYLKPKYPTSVYTEVGHFVEGDTCLRLLQILVEEREEGALPEKGILRLEDPVILIGIDE